MTQPQDDAISAWGDASQKLKPSAQSLHSAGPAQRTNSENSSDVSGTSSKNNNCESNNHTFHDPVPYHMDASSTHHKLPGSDSVVEGKTADNAAGPSEHDAIQHTPSRRWSFGRGQSATSMDSSRVLSYISDSTAFLHGLPSNSSISSRQNLDSCDGTASTLVSNVNDAALSAAVDASATLQGPAEAAAALLQQPSTIHAAAVPTALQSGDCDQLPTCTQAACVQAGQQGGDEVQAVQPAVLTSQPGVSVQEQPMHLQETQPLHGADATSSRTHSTSHQQVTVQDQELSQQQHGDPADAARQHHQDKDRQHSLPMPALIALGVAAAGAAVGLAFVLIRKLRQGSQAGDDNIIIDEEDAAFEAQIKAMEEEEKKAAAADAAAAAAAADDATAAMSAEEAELAAKQAEAATKERILAAALAKEDAEMAKIDALHSDDLLELGEDELAELEAELAALEAS